MSEDDDFKRWMEEYQRGYRDGVKERERIGHLTHQNLLLVEGFLGGIAFAGLILVVGSQPSFEGRTNLFLAQGGYTLLLLGLGLTTTVEIIGTMASVLVASERASPDGWLGTIGEWSLFIGVFLLLWMSADLVEVANMGVGALFFLLNIGLFLAVLLAFALERREK